jgi:hypothetical protein
MEKRLSLLIIPLLAFSSVLLFSGCQKRGCTNPNSINYDPEATRDDGSCILPGGGGNGNPVELCGEITQDVTWGPTGATPDYLVTCDLTLNADVVVEPGVVIVVENDHGIDISYNGSLKAIGTATEPIRFMGESDVAGTWEGLFFHANNVNNQLDHCDIRGGGSSSHDGAEDLKCNIRVDNNAQLRISNTTLAKSTAYGMYVEGLSHDTESPIKAFSAVTFEDNGTFPLSVPAPVVNDLDGAGSSFSGNGRFQVEIRAGRMLGTHVWESMDVPYLVSGPPHVGYTPDVGNLEVREGVILQFAADQGLEFGLGATGYISMEGTASQPIFLTGEQDVPGSWKGIYFDTDNVLNKLKHVRVYYGGAGAFTGNSQSHGNVVVDGTLFVEDVEVKYSSTCGVSSRADSDYTEGNNVDVSSNVNDYCTY